MTNNACKNVGLGHLKPDPAHDDHGQGYGYGHCGPEPTPTPTPTPVVTPTPTPVPQADTHTVPIQGTLLLVPILVVAALAWLRKK